MRRPFFAIVCWLAWVVTVTPSLAAPDVQAPLYKLETIIGQVVKDQHGTEVGRIEEIVIDAATGEVPYAVLGAGGILNLGEKLRAVPWHALQRPTAETFRLAVTAEQLKSAPSFGRDDWPDMEARHWDDAVHAYYGQPPVLGKRLPPKTGEAPATPAPARLLRGGYVLQREVVNPRGQRLGTLKEVVVDAAAGKVAYVVLETGGVLGVGEKLFAIPWAALQQSAGLGTLTLDVDKETLQAARGFDKEQWPATAETRWGGTNTP